MMKIPHYSDQKKKLSTGMIQKLIEQSDPRIHWNGDIYDLFEYSGKDRNYYNYIQWVKKFRPIV